MAALKWVLKQKLSIVMSKELSQQYTDKLQEITGILWSPDADLRDLQIAHYSINYDFATDDSALTSITNKRSIS